MGMLLFAGGVAVVVGVLIGAIGIGGVLLVPMLTYVLGISIHVAIATA
ncbi:MAG TPA: sulfite exporter TauE/SafE family protein, partial [Gammaproteobacteria bacterium]|nr:sulfite exporter TauE/SafE family protein [Gammaproteobacteria bacterium]